MARKLYFLLALMSVLWIAACGSGSGGSGSSTITSVSVGCSPTTVTSGGISQCTATVSGTGNFNSGVNWSATDGTVDASGLFLAPPIVTTSEVVTITATSMQDNSKSGSATVTVNPNNTASNVTPLVVDQGPAPQSFLATNQAFVSVTVCVPGTNTCQTIDHVEVDTGSSGLRLISSAVTIPLPQNNSSLGNPMDECLVFLDGFVWGPVVSADISMAGELASNTPVQLIIPSTTAPPVPGTCSGQTTGPDEGDNGVQSLGANGILGVGLFQQDCGLYCVNNAGPDFYVYYDCPASGCNPTTATLAQQLPNPVINFAGDNNGVLLQLPSVGNGGAGTVNGSLIFGIGTQANNTLNGATVYAVPNSGSNAGDFTTIYNGTSTPGFVDSGSNGYFFADSTIPTCPSPNDVWYCPLTSPDNLSAQNQGTNMGSPVTSTFSLEDATALFSGNNVAFSTLGGTFPSSPSGTSFDWGLSFFYGKNVFTAVDGAGTAGGTGPYVAF